MPRLAGPGPTQTLGAQHTVKFRGDLCDVMSSALTAKGNPLFFPTCVFLIKPYAVITIMCEQSDRRPVADAAVSGAWFSSLLSLI